MKSLFDMGAEQSDERIERYTREIDDAATTPRDRGHAVVLVDVRDEVRARLARDILERHTADRVTTAPPPS